MGTTTGLDLTAPNWYHGLMGTSVCACARACARAVACGGVRWRAVRVRCACGRVAARGGARWRAVARGCAWLRVVARGGAWLHPVACACARARARARVRVRVWVCVCVYHLNRCKTSNLQGVTGVPGGSVTNEDTSPGPV